jgi:hypothetical protein
VNESDPPTEVSTIPCLFPARYFCAQNVPGMKFFFITDWSQFYKKEMPQNRAFMHQLSENSETLIKFVLFTLQL